MEISNDNINRHAEQNGNSCGILTLDKQLQGMMADKRELDTPRNEPPNSLSYIK